MISVYVTNVSKVNNNSTSLCFDILCDFSDLRHNHLASVSDKSFDGLVSLKNLLLSGNQLLYIDNNGFHGLAAIQFL